MHPQAGLCLQTQTLPLDPANMVSAERIWQIGMAINAVDKGFTVICRSLFNLVKGLAETAALGQPLLIWFIRERGA